MYSKLHIIRRIEVPDGEQRCRRVLIISIKRDSCRSHELTTNLYSKREADIRYSPKKDQGCLCPKCMVTPPIPSQEEANHSSRLLLKHSRAPVRSTQAYTTHQNCHFELGKEAGENGKLNGSTYQWIAQNDGHKTGCAATVIGISKINLFEGYPKRLDNYIRTIKAHPNRQILSRAISRLRMSYSQPILQSNWHIVTRISGHIE
ncbi:unnamed protein product [Timema podura]|uniref:Uncharacterized protein n=1 Tax=Timema podura TaxID=61482 RepID=A0ABN7NLG7_TIMPD|nr:unnamed protein product [Timema podura]